ncbi:Hypothetical predicted protein [Mytilus galloprovincialis]|uniref:Fibronectin type-III domain-containing protein n=1 Tax=Mytilus galloprovincialis TaxID=29158 RepID=A0A8B6FCS1_MYTGA|nr:Hypothetical predicted protein [Mytilus galloprovincialis]
MSVFTSDNINRVKQYGEIDKAVDINVNVYSVPKFKRFIWTYHGIQITQNSAKYETSTSPSIVKDDFHGTEVQLDGFNVTLTIHNLIYSDFGNYTVTLKNGFGTVEQTITLEITGIPETPGNFSMRTTSTTSITIVWDPNSGGGHVQTFYIQFRVQGYLSWTAVSAGEEGINKQKRRRTYKLKNLQEGQTYELRMFSENTAGKRSNYTEVLVALTESSEILTSSSTVVGGVVGAGVMVGILCASVMGIVFFKRRKGQDQTEKNDKSHENTGFQQKQKENEYEEVGNKCDVQQKQSSKTYESLGIKDTLNVYDDLENPKGLIPSKSSLGLYEALGNQDKPSIYSALQNQKEQTQLRKQPAETDIRKASNNPKENLELYTNQRPIENVYDNEGF